MAFLNFPASPSNGQIFQVSGGSDTDVYVYYNPPGAWFKLSVPHASYQASGFTTLWRSRFDAPSLSAQTALAIQWLGLSGYSAGVYLEPNKPSSHYQAYLESTAGGVTTRLGVDANSGINGARFKHNSSDYRLWHDGNDGAGSTLNADLLDSLDSATGATPSTIAARDASGHITANHFNSTDSVQSGSLLYVMGKHNNGPDNYIRSYTQAAVRTFLGVTSTPTGSGAPATWDANSYFYANYFNQSSGSETPTVGYFIVTNTVDGYFRKVTPAWAAAGLGISPKSTTTPTVTATAGTFTTVSCEVNYEILVDCILVNVVITITNNGTASGAIIVPLPVSAIEECNFIGRENTTTGHTCNGILTGGSSNLIVIKYDNTYPGGTGYRISLTGFLFRV